MISFILQQKTALLSSMYMRRQLIKSHNEEDRIRFGERLFNHEATILHRHNKFQFQ
jgi:hypothetical protein